MEAYPWWCAWCPLSTVITFTTLPTPWKSATSIVSVFSWNTELIPTAVLAPTSPHYMCWILQLQVFNNVYIKYLIFKVYANCSTCPEFRNMATHVLTALSVFIGGFWIHSCSQQLLKTFKNWQKIERHYFKFWIWWLLLTLLQFLGLQSPAQPVICVFKLLLFDSL